MLKKLNKLLKNKYEADIFNTYKNGLEMYCSVKANDGKIWHIDGSMGVEGDHLTFSLYMSTLSEPDNLIELYDSYRINGDLEGAVERALTPDFVVIGG
jgi:hypothetical protein